MNLGIVGKATGKLGRFIIKNSSTICTIVAGIGVGVTAIETGKATLEAHDILVMHETDEELKCERYETINGVEQEPLIYYRSRTFWEKVKLTWKCFIVPVAFGGSTILLIFGAHRINMKRQMTLAAAYKISEQAAKEFRDKVTETIGEKKMKKIDTEIAQDRVQNTPLPDDDYIIKTGKGTELMYDSWTHQYFLSSQIEVERAVNRLNARVNARKCAISVNDYYEELGIPLLDNVCGNEFGWNYDIYSEGETIPLPDFDAVFSPVKKPCTYVKIDPEMLYTYGEV